MINCWRKIFQAVFLTALSFSIVVGFYYLSVVNNQSVVDSSTSSVSTASLAPGCGNTSGVPTDNPIALKYGSAAYSWTETIRWNCVYNINDFSGTTMDDRFQAARDAAAAAGGGVVYFPAGTYRFTDSIYLTDGVVMRGETPSVTDAKSSSYNPPSKLVFPKYEPRLSGEGTPNKTAFKKILTTSPDTDSNIGIVNLDINRAGINLLGDLTEGKKQNILIFGFRSNNVASPDPKVPDRSFQEGWMRYSYRFAANVKINAFANVLVSNNRINDAITDNYDQPGYKVKAVGGNRIVTYSDGRKAPFHYGNHYGIVVNRSGKFGYAEDPTTQPGLFRKGIVIRDNWVYHTMRTAIQAAGQGLVIKDNTIRDQENKQWWLHSTGTKQPKGSNTFENRAIDWSGWDVVIEGNDYQVYGHRIMDSKYYSVDGEGILIQECCGGTKVNGAIIRNNQGNGYIGLYKVPEIKNVTITGNRLDSQWKKTPLIYVSADRNRGPSSMSNVRIENNRVNGSILAKASLGGTGNRIENNRGDNSGSIKYSCQIRGSGNTGFELEPCLPGKT